MNCKKKILLVDDSATTLMMQKMILRAEPYEIVVARNGREALEVAAAENPDVILLDVVMPEMDGLETCRRLRIAEATRSTPVIMVTTRGEQTNIEAAFENGCTDYVTKPIDGIELLHKIRAAAGDFDPFYSERNQDA